MKLNIHQQDIFYNTKKLSIGQRKAVCDWAKERCFNWWIDELDCSKSWQRKKN